MSWPTPPTPKDDIDGMNDATSSAVTPSIVIPLGITPTLPLNPKATATPLTTPPTILVFSQLNSWYAVPVWSLFELVM